MEDWNAVRKRSHPEPRILRETKISDICNIADDFDSSRFESYLKEFNPVIEFFRFESNLTNSPRKQSFSLKRSKTQQVSQKPLLRQQKPLKATLLLDEAVISSFKLTCLPGNNMMFFLSETIPSKMKKVEYLAFRQEASAYTAYFNKEIKEFALKQIIENGNPIAFKLNKNALLKLPCKLKTDKLVFLLEICSNSLSVTKIDLELKTRITTREKSAIVNLVSGLKASKKGEWCFIESELNVRCEATEVALKEQTYTFQNYALTVK